MLLNRQLTIALKQSIATRKSEIQCQRQTRSTSCGKCWSKSEDGQSSSGMQFEASGDSIQYSPNQTILPNGVVWLNDQNTQEYLYGSNYGFVMHKDKVGGEGLVVYNYQPPLRPMFWNYKDYLQFQGGISIFQQPQQSVVISDGPIDKCLTDIVDTQGVVVEEKPLLALPPPSGHQLVDIEQQSQYPEIYEANNSTPSRTSKLRYTCNKCLAINVISYNPISWNKGALFHKCMKCYSKHLLKDNIKWLKKGSERRGSYEREQAYNHLLELQEYFRNNIAN